METVIFDETPLADYLKDEGEEPLDRWPSVEDDKAHPQSSSPSFAPVGRPTVKKRFRSKIPDRLRLDIPPKSHLRSLQNTYSKAVASKIDGADNSKFLEQFRYTIIASQLLSGHSIIGHHQLPAPGENESPRGGHEGVQPTSIGMFLTAAGAFALAWFMSWICVGWSAHLTKKWVLFALALLVVASVVFYAYVRQQWLRYLRKQSVAEITAFVSNSQDFDSATGAAIVLVQEVELVSRGYRISAPLPPITRIEDRSQTRRCRRLRKVLKSCFQDAVQKYEQVSLTLKGFTEQLDLERYYIMYDIGDFDLSDASQGFTDTEFDDPESLRALKIVAARFHTIRKIFLCVLLALEARGDDSDFLRWSTAMEGLCVLNNVTQECYNRLRVILCEEEAFPAIPTPKVPLSPGRERWRSQLRKLSSLSTGIRGLHAKMTLLREESDRSLNEAEDVSELGPNLMTQYESIGQDLKMLIQAWEEGKAALASGIDRNEKRLSSLSSILMSPATSESLSGLTTVEEGGAAEALKALTGDSPRTLDFGSPVELVAEEVFEAIALSRPRSLLTREERIAKMREERERREDARVREERNLGMLHELETVIKGRSNATSAPGRVSF